MKKGHGSKVCEWAISNSVYRRDYNQVKRNTAVLRITNFRVEENDWKTTDRT